MLKTRPAKATVKTAAETSAGKIPAGKISGQKTATRTAAVKKAASATAEPSAPAAPQEMALGEVYQLLEPGPVVLLATRARATGPGARSGARGAPNVMAMSWHMMVEFNPPLVACVVSSGDHSFTALTERRQCVIAIPGVELAQKVVGIGNCSGRDTDKFAAFGLTPLDGRRVAAPLIAECYANLECVVADTRLVNRYGLFILEVVAAWVDPSRPAPKTIHHRGYGTFSVDGETIHLPSRMP